MGLFRTLFSVIGACVFIALLIYLIRRFLRSRNSALRIPSSCVPVVNATTTTTTTYPAQSQYPPAQSQYPPAQPQYPPAQPQYPPAQPQYPPAQPQYPPAQSQYPPAQPEYPPAQSQYPPPPSYEAARGQLGPVPPPVGFVTQPAAPSYQPY